MPIGGRRDTSSSGVPARGGLEADRDLTTSGAVSLPGVKLDLIGFISERITLAADPELGGALLGYLPVVDPGEQVALDHVLVHWQTSAAVPQRGTYDPVNPESPFEIGVRRGTVGFASTLWYPQWYAAGPYDPQITQWLDRRCPPWLFAGEQLFVVAGAQDPGVVAVLNVQGRRYQVIGGA